MSYTKRIGVTVALLGVVILTVGVAAGGEYSERWTGDMVGASLESGESPRYGASAPTEAMRSARDALAEQERVLTTSRALLERVVRRVEPPARHGAEPMRNALLRAEEMLRAGKLRLLEAQLATATCRKTGAEPLHGAPLSRPSGATELTSKPATVCPNDATQPDEETAGVRTKAPARDASPQPQATVRAQNTHVLTLRSRPPQPAATRRDLLDLQSGEWRIAQLATELEAVRAAQPLLASGIIAPLAALGDDTGAPTEGDPAELKMMTEAEASDKPGQGDMLAQAGSPAVTKLRTLFDSLTGAVSPQPAEPQDEPLPGTEIEVVEATAEPVAEEAPEVVPEGAVSVPAPYEGDPLEQPVNLDFRETRLSSVIKLLAEMAQINVIGGDTARGTITAQLKNVPLRQAMETALSMNNLGIIEEAGIFRIVSFEEAVAARRATRMVYLENAQAAEVKTTLEDILVGAPEASLMSVSANESMNVVIISGPEAKVVELEELVEDLDLEEPILPTVTEAIKLNYAEPAEVATILDGMITRDLGKVATDSRGRRVIVTDMPVVLEEIRLLVEQVDTPVKQVSIETMLVDAVLSDTSQTGVQWLLNAVRRQNTRGEIVGNLQQLSFGANMPVTQTVLPGSTVAFGILSGDIDLSGLIAAEVQASNADLFANPVVVTVENQEARISISEEIPYQELTQTTTGPPIATTEFKEVGTILEVTPRVTHDNHVIVNVVAKQSVATEVSVTGVPVEDKREAETTLRVYDGQSIFIGGLRKFQDRRGVRKVPVLGDIPVLSAMFRNQSIVQEITELLVFITCHVVKDELPELTPYQQDKFDGLGGTPDTPDGQRALFHDLVRTDEMRDPAWKWRRKK